MTSQNDIPKDAAPMDPQLGIGADTLAQDKIPDANQSRNCFSCGEPVHGLFCSACGQKNDNYRRSVSTLMKEFIPALTTLNGPIWKTWRAILFEPGRCAREYADGARTRWTSPARIYLTISLVLFTYLSLSGTQPITLDINVQPKPGVTKTADQLTASDLAPYARVLFFENRREAKARLKNRNFDLLEMWLKDNTAQPPAKADKPAAHKADENGADENGADENSADNNGSDENSPDTTEVLKSLKALPMGTVSLEERPLEKLLPADNPAKQEAHTNVSVTKSLTGLNTHQFDDLVLRIIKEPALVNNGLFKWLPRIMFFMMPFTMLLGAIFIRGKNALLYDHLVHSTYLHAFAYFLLIIGAMFSHLLPGLWILMAISLILLIYLPLSVRRMFGSSWPKSVFTSYSVGTIHILTVFALLALVIYKQITSIIPTL